MKKLLVKTAKILLFVVIICILLLFGLFYYIGINAIPIESHTMHDSRSGDICPKCQSKNVANIVYGYPAKGWGALAEDKKSYFHGCALPKNPKKYHCNDCKYEWGSIEEVTRDCPSSHFER